MTLPARYLLVCCEAGLDESRIAGLFHAFNNYPGVECVMDADIAGLTRTQLEVIKGMQPKSALQRLPKVKLSS